MADHQEILQLWLAAAALDAEVKGWARYGGAADADTTIDGADGPGGAPPYRTGVDALADGWRLLQAPGPIDVVSTNGELGCEFVFTRLRPAD